MALVVDSFRGVNHRLAPEDLFEIEKGRARAFLRAAVNVDVTDAGALKRRRGVTLQVSGNWHSLWEGPGYALAVRDNRLVRVGLDLTVTDLAAASERPLAYALAPTGEVFFSDGRSLGVYQGASVEFLAQAGSYERTAQYLDQSEDAAFYDAPPPGVVLEFWAGRLWSFDAEAGYYSRPFFPRRFDLRQDFIPWPGVTLFKGVTDGAYLGTDSAVWFLSGLDPKALRPVQVCGSGAVAGTALSVQAEKFRLDGAYGPAVVWESAQGKMLGLAGGRVLPLTQETVSYGIGERGASLLREQGGLTQHLSVFRAPGDGSNMRASDIAVAEVRRNGIII